MNETEKLGKEIQRILLQYMKAIHAELIHSHDDVFLTDKILQACKEAGLKFVQFPEIIGGRATQYPQIKEIELEK